MNFVVVDFEWNQSSYGRGTNRRVPFEIIEIGAVLLDDQFRELDRFSETIKPKIYKRLHHVTRDLTGITQKELDHSDPFPYVLVDFMLWCGDDFTFCTWGNTDLIELQRNMKYYHLEDLLEGPIRYYNVQKMFREFYQPDVSAASLESAVDLLKIPRTEGDFHRAINDAAYTAEILKQMDPEKADRLYSVDYYQNPKCREDEIHLTYDDYYKYISREFKTKEDAMGDKEVRSTRCFLCGRQTRKRIFWFTGKAKACYCLAWCPEHGYLRGKIRVKKTDEDQLYIVKTLRLADEEEVQHIRQMKLDMAAKRRQRRHRGAVSDQDISDDAYDYENA